ncbi:ATP-binding protein [Paraburkholderia nodosa]|uniref:ATP-binding protein n=1 Tax=Paraburkholderia nodosa TaxID=392320 RepID=UPI001FE0436D|nr:ATP-binding protein [Paraburkholderia nodosa]
MRASYPDALIELRFVGDLRGRWDGGRIGQLIVNLLTNVVRYGSGQIVVEARAHDGQVTVVVGNKGNPIPERALPTLFDPLTRAPSPDRSGMAAGTVGMRPPSEAGRRAGPSRSGCGHEASFARAGARTLRRRFRPGSGHLNREHSWSAPQWMAGKQCSASLP